ncbi:phenoloxidase 2-like [Diprion similis]|uniref:phenoloxidase 2-like n=1 Tax=Diprion similis TaxID=362088 RepID=UPI001EF83C64|nr:phenoloxidase 2-like [Diprion similis]
MVLLLLGNQASGKIRIGDHILKLQQYIYQPKRMTCAYGLFSWFEKLRRSEKYHYTKMEKPTKENMLDLFIRPGEPCCMPKGNENILFKISDEKTMYDRYRHEIELDEERFGADKVKKIEVRRLSMENIDKFMELSRDEAFSVFVPKHAKLAGELTRVFMEAECWEDFLALAVRCRDKLNPVMFYYAYSVALLHRPDTKDLSLPSPCEYFPNKFVSARTLAMAKEVAYVMSTTDSKPIPLREQKQTASDIEPEHSLAYFREDLGINMHHWHWHLVYPGDGISEIVVKNRRGELFYYMHQQIIARYDFERFSNNLPRVKPFDNWRKPFDEEYFPKLDSVTGSKISGRQNGAVLSNVNREPYLISIDQLQRWRDRILDAIHLGFVWDEAGQKVELTEDEGIEILGNLIEASELSKNSAYYGNLHNSGHVAIGLCHDPDNRHLESIGVMGDNAMAMRDPIFYRWHTFVNDIFRQYKDRLDSYTVEELDHKGVKVTGLNVISKNYRENNVFRTFWEESNIDVSNGLDFAARGAARIRFTHLNHELFEYKIDIENSSPTETKGTVRIFMAPKYNDRKLPLNFAEQQGLMIELDKFSVVIPPGSSSHKRLSTESSVTIPFERTFPEGRKDLEEMTEAGKSVFNYCGCGWPQHMLIPKGNELGLSADLFVMVSNYDVDMYDVPVKKCCKDAVSYCGLKDSIYPDRRKMGYPFDRPPPKGTDGTVVKTLDNFCQLTENMAFTEVKIIFKNDTPTDDDDSEAAR